MKKKKKYGVEKLLTWTDVSDPFTGFANDKERIKYVSKHYKNMSLSKAFAVFYNIDINQEIKADKNVNSVVNVEVGKTYIGSVKSFDKNGFIFVIPGVKEEILSKETFSNCKEAIDNYLLTHENKLWFKVREKKDNRFNVSIIEGFYQRWLDEIEKCITKEDGIQVHIDSLVRGGYVCHTQIWTLAELTQTNYTSSVFIPGSHIVLNIENDFEKWIGEDVIIVPQKIVQFKKFFDGTSENSIVGSRKRVLQIKGIQNMYDIYTDIENQKKLAKLAGDKVSIGTQEFEGIVTGIINSNNKTGIFIELKDKYITGLMPIDSSNLVNYKPGNSVFVRIKEFEVQEGREPFQFNKRGKLIRCNIRPVYELA